MKKEIIRYSGPGSWDVEVPFNKIGIEQEWVAILDARKSGEYTLNVAAVHRAAKTKGRVVVKVVVGAGARVRVKGVIKILPGAQETENFLELRALCLDPTSAVRLDPELEIEANNVVASHAASVGGVEEEQIKYLMGKGLSEVQAKSEIVRGWLAV